MRVPLMLLVIALALVGCGREKVEGTGPQASPTAPAAVPVRTEKAVQGALEETVTLTGHLRALSKAQVHSRLSGRVVAVHVREGDQVAAGEALLELDSTSLHAAERQAAANLRAAQARLQQAQTGRGLTDVQVDLEVRRVQQSVFQAEANTARAKAEYDDAVHDQARQRDLFKKSAVSRVTVERAELRARVAQEQLDAARSAEKAAREGVRIAESNRGQVGMRESEVEGAAAGVDQARAALESVQVDLRDTVLRSPISGTVVSRAVEPGQAVNAQTGGPLVVLVDNSTLDMVAPTDERHRAWIRPGTRVSISTSLGDAVTGKVVDVVPASDPSTHTVKVRVKIPNPGGELVEGAFATAHLPLRRVEGVVVPRQAVLGKGADAFVMVAEGGVAHRRPVKVTFSTDRQSVVSGVKPGDAVVVAGAEKLEDGQALQEGGKA